MGFPIAIGILDAGAAWMYIRAGNWRLAIVWLLYGVCAVLLGGL